MSKKYFYATFVAFLINATFSVGKLLFYSRTLGSEDFGYYSISLLLVTIGSYFTCLGLIEGLNRLLPIEYAKKNYLRYNYYASKSISFCLCFSTFFSVVFLILISNSDGMNYLSEVRVATLLLMATVLFNVSTALIRAKCKTFELNLITLTKTVLTVIVGVLSYKFWGFNGLVIGESVVLLICAAFTLYYAGIYRISLRLNRLLSGSHYVNVVKVGFPFMVGNLVLTMSNTADSLFVQYNFPPSQYAVYAFCFIIYSAGQNLNTLIAQFYQPRLYAAFALDGLYRKLQLNALLVSLSIAFLYVCAYLPSAYSFDYIVDNFFTDYHQAKELFSFIFVGTSCMAVITVLESPVLLKKRGLELNMIYFLGMLVSLLLCSYYSFANNLELATFAFVFMLSKLIILLMILFYNFALYRYN